MIRYEYQNKMCIVWRFRTYWYQTDCPLGLIFTLGSAKPRTPDIVPKYYNTMGTWSAYGLYLNWGFLLQRTCWKERFSIMSMITCLISPREAALAALVRANRARYLDIMMGYCRIGRQSG
jgi:hypothetical protein